MRRTVVLAALALTVTGCHHRAAPAAPAPTPAASGPSLFERLGGQTAVRAVVDTFVANVAADTRINAFFRGVDIPTFKQLLVEQVCQAAGGPCIYSGRPMRVAHRGMNITNAQFDALVEDLVHALNTFSVPEREKNELLTTLGGLRGEIVGK